MILGTARSDQSLASVKPGRSVHGLAGKHSLISACKVCPIPTVYRHAFHIAKANCIDNFSLQALIFAETIIVHKWKN